MSKQKKPRKLRRPNIVTTEGAPLGRPEPRVAVDHDAPDYRPARPDTVRGEFDYTDVKKDLRRIGVLAGSFIAILVVLSFFIR